MTISLVLMLSGRSRRFGANKLLARYQGKPLYQIALAQAKESGADHITVVTCYEEIRDYCEKIYPWMDLVHNDHPERGISESLKLGLRREMGAEMGAVTEAETEVVSLSGEARTVCSDGCCFPDGCCFLVGDQPLLSAISLQNLLSAFRSNPEKICLLSDGHHEGNPAVFPRWLYGELLSLEGDKGGKAVARRHPETVLRILTGNQGELFDVDYMDDLRYTQKENNSKT